MKKLSLLIGCFFPVLLQAQWSAGGSPKSFEENSAAFISPVSYVSMPSFGLAEIRSADSINDQSKLAYRFGYNHTVDIDLHNSGAWSFLPGGERIWRIGIIAENAQSINLGFDDFEMPEGAALFIYSADKKIILGAFTTANNTESKKFATDLIQSDSVIIEYDEPVSVAGKGRLHLFRVTHGYRSIKNFYTTRSFGDAGNCQVNVNCPLGDDWQKEKRGIICLVVGGNEFCSAVLLNDVPQDGTPYVLTANHCSNNDVALWVFRFNWEAADCADPPLNPGSQSLSGGELVARSDTSDFCLVAITGGLIDGAIPSNYNPYFNGWSAMDVPAEAIIGIHHPGGDIKKISAALNPTTSQYYDGVQCWKIGEWTTGCTEPGSSGSPVFDQDHRIVGQLYDGPSACGQPADLMYDYYGKFSVSWQGNGTNETQLKHWLDPGNTGTLIIDGYDGAINAVVPTAVVASMAASAFPNPNNGDFEITITGNSSPYLQWSVTDLTGRSIYPPMIADFVDGKSIIAFSNLAPGIYLVHIKCSGHALTQKVMAW